MIRNTHERNPAGVLSAYRDNAAVIEGSAGARYFPDPSSGIYRASHEPIDILMKVETHNHPTAISPFPGAATGSGGEIRDEGATGRGAKPKAGLAGFSVSNLRIPGYEQPWEHDFGKPARIASALEIMLEGPIGAASFNNEFGRPTICGYFRTFEQPAAGDAPERVRGYHKPIMIAGGLGNVRRAHVHKGEVPVGAKLVVLGGPAMLIGLGGGAASSVGSGASACGPGFRLRAARQSRDRAPRAGSDRSLLGARRRQSHRPDPRRRRRRAVQCRARGGRAQRARRAHRSARRARAPSRACRRWRSGATRRRSATCWRCEPKALARIQRHRDARALPVRRDRRDRRRRACCGCTTRCSATMPVDMPHRGAARQAAAHDARGAQRRRHGAAASTAPRSMLREALYRVLRLPAVADKTFLITIGDRTVGGLISRDQLVGPWQVPVSDVAVTLSRLPRHTPARRWRWASARRWRCSMPPASARLAVAEAITNILAADIAALGDVRLSANWMAACGEPGEDAALYATVRAVGKELCPALGIAIPVGKDSLSMKTAWQRGRRRARAWSRRCR